MSSGISARLWVAEYGHGDKRMLISIWYTYYIDKLLRIKKNHFLKVKQ